METGWKFCVQAWILLSIFLPMYQTDGALDNPGGGGCVYSFQVWTPNEDVLRRIRDLEYKCSNNTAEWERYLNRLRGRVLTEMLSTRNLTNKIEKDLLEQKLEDVHLKINMKDITMEMNAIRNENTELRTIIDENKVRGGGNRQVDRSLQVEMSQLTARVNNMQSLVGQLKNGVGDLKAEWLLIKREVQDTRAEVSQLRYGPMDSKEDPSKLRDLVEALQTDTVMLKSETEDIKAMNTKLARAIGDIKSDGGVKFTGGDDLNDKRVDRQIDDLKDQNSELQRQVERIREENSNLKREVIAVALAARNVSQDEIASWLSKLPNIQIPPAPKVPMGKPGDPIYPRDCNEVYERGFLTSGVYQIKPRDSKQLDNVYCEMINGTGWTMLSRRSDGALSFNRRWMEYKFGFGGLYGEFWIGNQMIHWLTSQRQMRLRIDMWDWEGGRAYAEYTYFKVDSEVDKFTVHIRGYEGDAGDSLSYHDEMAFSTEDSDNDLHMRNCAVDNKGGWWFNSCYTANPNGIYHTGWYSHGSQTYADGIIWFTLKESEFYSLKHVELKVRPSYL